MATPILGAFPSLWVPSAYLFEGRKATKQNTAKLFSFSTFIKNTDLCKNVLRALSTNVVISLYECETKLELYQLWANS